MTQRSTSRILKLLTASLTGCIAFAVNIGAHFAHTTALEQDPEGLKGLSVIVFMLMLSTFFLHFYALNILIFGKEDKA